jgi:hypothetical protein
MPFIAAIVGAIFTGLFYWLIWGKGLEYLEHQWRESSNRRRDAKRRSAAIQQQQLAPIRSITDSPDAASVINGARCAAARGTYPRAGRRY